MEITIKRELDDQFVSDILVTAFDGDYGGSWYWADPAKDKADWLETNHAGLATDARWIAVHISLKEKVGIGVIDSHVSLKVDEEAIRVGLQRICDEDFIKGGGRTMVNSRLCQVVRDAVAEDDTGMIDADAADCIVQVGLFGGVIYG